jgi:hypothetical protein
MNPTSNAGQGFGGPGGAGPGQGGGAGGFAVKKFIQVEMILGDYTDKLERSINTWLGENKSAEVVDIKYEMSPNQNANGYRHSALIIYKTEQSKKYGTE